MTWTRRDVLTTSALAAAAFAAGRPRPAGAQGKPITVAHSVSTFVYGQHLVAREKKFFEEEGVRVANFIVPGGGARVVNAVTAGLVKTEQSHLFYGDEEGIAAVGATVPLGRMAEPSDVADVCLFLASPLARYVSGESTVVHGGGELPAYLGAAKNANAGS